MTRCHPARLALCAVITLATWASGLPPQAEARPVPTSWTYTRRGAPIASRGGIVTSASAAASRVGSRILEQGGNAFDAAVAVHFALAVAFPEAGNLGGGGFWVLREASGSTWTLDAREVAPRGASRDMFLDATGRATDRSVSGGLAVGVPCSVQGCWEVHRRLGSLPWARCLAPAIELARDGVTVDAGLATSFRRCAALLARRPATRDLFMPLGKPLVEGDRLVQADLARTIEAIAAEGPDAFHRGRIARAIATSVQAEGGILDEQDLAHVRAVWREPLRFSYRGYRFTAMPPPSSGGVVLGECLGMLESTDVRASGFHDPDLVHRIAEVERRAFADRNTYLADPDFVPFPLARLMDRDYLKTRAGTIDPDRTTPDASHAGGLNEHLETTHFTIVDEAGHAASVTTTLNGSFGTGILAEGTGVFLNNEMDDFATRPGFPNQFGLVQSEANAVAPGKRPLSSMCPVIAEDETGSLAFALGSPGGSTIPTSVLQVVLNMVDLGMDARQAVEAPRFHHQGLPERLDLEAGGFDVETREALVRKGHVLFERPLGDVHLVRRLPDGSFEGWSDPRRGGLAVSVTPGRKSRKQASGLAEPEGK